jgi:hypothetical protein
MHERLQTGIGDKRDLVELRSMQDQRDKLIVARFESKSRYILYF